MKILTWTGVVFAFLMWSLPAQAASISPAHLSPVQALDASAVTSPGGETANVVKVRHRGLAAGIAFGAGVLLLNELARERRHRHYHRSHAYEGRYRYRRRCRRWLNRCDLGVRWACRKYYRRCY